MNASKLQTLGLVLASLLTGAGVTSLVFVRMLPGKEKEAAPPEERVAKKEPENVLRLNATLAKAYGIETGPAEHVDWHPRLIVDGRVLVNPHAALEVRAPFAGVLHADAFFRIGMPVKALEPLARFEARFSPLEKLDLKAKSLEAETRYKSAEDVLKIREERAQRLNLLQSGSISRSDLELAAIQVAEAKMLKDVALSQWSIWKQAHEASAKKSIIVPIPAPLTGEIAEIGAQPGANVEVGQLLVRIVDFRRVLVRLDFPSSNTTLTPPEDVEVETLGTLQEKPAPWRAHLRGPAPNVEVGLQKASYLYEIVPVSEGSAPSWRPGLYVKAILPDPAKKLEPAVAFPASAVLVHQGRTLVYVYIPDDRYKRLEVEVLDRVGDIVYVSAKGWYPDDRVVVKQAQVLLSEEFRRDTDDE